MDRVQQQKQQSIMHNVPGKTKTDENGEKDMSQKLVKIFKQLKCVPRCIHFYESQKQINWQTDRQTNNIIKTKYSIK